MHLRPLLESQFEIQASSPRVGNYKPLLPDSIIHNHGKDIEILPGNEHVMARGPAYFKWTVGRLLPTTMVEIIKEKFSDEAAVLKKHVRGIRPRVGVLSNPREGEPMEYVLVLADIMKANDPDKGGTIPTKRRVAKTLLSLAIFRVNSLIPFRFIGLDIRSSTTRRRSGKLSK